MKMKTELKKLCAIAPKVGVVPIIENVLFKNSKMTATDLHFTLSLPCPVPFTGEGLISAHWLKKIAEKVKIERIEFNDARAQVYTDNGVFRCINEDTENFPKLQDTSQFKPVLRFEIGEWFNQAVKFVSKHELRPAMHHVAVDKERYYASDGHILFFGSHLGTGWDGNKDRILLNTMLSIVGKTEETIDLLFGNQTYAIQYADGTVATWKEIDENAPDYSSAIPEKTKHTTVIKDATKLKKQIDVAMLSANQVTSKIDFINGKLKAEDLDYDTEYTGNYDYTGEPLDISFNGKLLNKVLSEITGEVSARWIDQSKAVIINEEFLLMPMMRNR